MLEARNSPFSSLICACRSVCMCVLRVCVFSVCIVCRAEGVILAISRHPQREGAVLQHPRANPQAN